jgi:hypothetical protein
MDSPQMLQFKIPLTCFCIWKKKKNRLKQMFKSLHISLKNSAIQLTHTKSFASNSYRNEYWHCMKTNLICTQSRYKVLSYITCASLVHPSRSIN